MHPNILGQIDPSGTGQGGSGEGRSKGCNRNFLALGRGWRGWTACTTGSAVGFCCHLFLRKQKSGGRLSLAPEYICHKMDNDGRRIDADLNGKKCVYYCTSMDILNNHRRLLLHAWMCHRRWCSRWNHHWFVFDPVLGRQMNVYLGTIGCKNTITFVGMDVRLCTMDIHDSILICPQTTISIVVHRAVGQSYFCICTNTVYPTTMNIFQKLTSCCCSSGTIFHNHPTIPTLFETTLRYINIGPTPFTHQTWI